mmetsp:Transcript_104367/g.234301  ORF Transcript_104367/g.234301 Transcript_104367/m.234301 type:complete len:269 (+) Transcript_104367:76-882(+)
MLPRNRESLLPASLLPASLRLLLPVHEEVRATLDELELAAGNLGAHLAEEHLELGNRLHPQPRFHLVAGLLLVGLQGGLRLLGQPPGAKHLEVLLLGPAAHQDSAHGLQHRLVSDGGAGGHAVPRGCDGDPGQRLANLLSQALDQLVGVVRLSANTYPPVQLQGAVFLVLLGEPAEEGEVPAGDVGGVPHGQCAVEQTQLPVEPPTAIWQPRRSVIVVGLVALPLEVGVDGHSGDDRLRAVARHVVRVLSSLADRNVRGEGLGQDADD